MQNNVKDVVTLALYRLISSATGLTPPDPMPAPPKFIQDAIDQAVADIEQLLAQTLKDNEAAKHNLDVAKDVLGRISRWHGEFPEVTDREGNSSTYGALYGSNGERDFMRKMATDTIETIFACNHEWISARNTRVASGEICHKCFSLRAEQAPDT